MHNECHKYRLVHRRFRYNGTNCAAEQQRKSLLHGTMFQTRLFSVSDWMRRSRRTHFGSCECVCISVRNGILFRSVGRGVRVCVCICVREYAGCVHGLECIIRWNWYTSTLGENGRDWFFNWCDVQVSDDAFFAPKQNRNYGTHTQKREMKDHCIHVCYVFVRLGENEQHSQAHIVHNIKCFYEIYEKPNGNTTDADDVNGTRASPASPAPTTTAHSHTKIRIGTSTKQRRGNGEK